MAPRRSRASRSKATTERGAPLAPADAKAADPTADDAESERGPLRRCIVTRVQAPKEQMLRFVVGPGHALVPDLAGRLPGRGIWLSARGDVLETARRRGAFSRAARSRVDVPDDLAAMVTDGLLRRIGETLGLARRAGQAVCGFTRCREWLQLHRAGLVVQASDGSPEERARLLGSWRDGPVITPLPGAALGAIFGREHVVHVAVAPGRLAMGLAAEAERLAGVRARDVAATVGGASTAPPGGESGAGAAGSNAPHAAPDGLSGAADVEVTGD